MKIDKLLIKVLSIPLIFSAIATQAELHSPPLSSRPLSEVLSDLKRQCGIESAIFHRPLEDRIALLGPGCENELQALFREYNYLSVSDAHGKVTRLIINSRKWDRATSASAHAGGEELLTYRNNVEAVPRFYQDMDRTRVWPIDLAGDRLSAMAPGDEWMLVLPGGHYRVVLDRLARYADQELSWSGHFTERGLTYHVALTLGPNRAVGQIESPEGLFKIEWIEHREWMINFPATGS